jgi:hypothetical protein
MSVGQTSPKRIVGVEKHFLLPDLLGRIPEIAARARCLLIVIVFGEIRPAFVSSVFLLVALSLSHHLFMRTTDSFGGFLRFGVLSGILRK